MDTSRKLSIEEKIVSLSQIIHREISYQEPRDIAEENNIVDKQENRINFFKKILYDLELQRDEPDWIVVQTQDRIDRDEVWRHKDPGPDFTSAKEHLSLLGKLLSGYRTKNIFLLGI